jgi:hypothetical protein
MRCWLLGASLLLSLSGMCAAADVEQLHRSALAALDKFQDCLADEYVKVARAKKMTEPEFVVYIGGVCIPSREEYRSVMREFLAIQFPMMKQSLHADSADEAVKQVQGDTVRAYVRGELHRE